MLLTQEFQVNLFSAADQSGARIANLNDGTFVVAWRSEGQDGQSGGIYAQRYSADGQRIGLEFGLANTTEGNAADVNLTALAGGGFVATWQDQSGRDGDAYGIFARVFDADAAPTGDNFLINQTTQYNQYQSTVTALDGGGFSVGWYHDSYRAGPEGSHYYAMIARSFDAAGAAVSDEFVASDPIDNNYQREPALITLGTGAGQKLLAVWRGYAPEDSDGVYARIMDPDGANAGVRILINEHTSSTQYQPQAAELADGRFVVVWRGAGAEDGDGIYGRVMNADGTPAAAQFNVNPIDYSTDAKPQAVARPDGGFTVVWQHYHQTEEVPAANYTYAIFAVDYAADLTAGAYYQVNELTAGGQYSPDVAVLSSGALAFVWDGDTGDGDGRSVRMVLIGDDRAMIAAGAAPKIEALPAAVTFAEADLNAGPVPIDIDGAAALSDTDSADFDGGRLILGTLAPTHADQPFAPADAGAQHVFAIRSVGTGAGEISVAGLSVRYQGVEIGQIAASGAQLIVELTAAADAVSVEALIENLTYANGSDDPLDTFKIALMLEDGDAMSSDPVLIDVTVTPEQDGIGAVGGPRVVNGSIAGVQAAPVVASLSDGAADLGYVIVWNDQGGADGSGQGVFGQRYAATGTRISDEFQVSEGASSIQNDPEIAALSNGGFVATWYSQTDTDGASSYDVMVRVFDADATPLGGEINLTRASFATNTESEPDVAATADGGFAVTWRSTLSADEVYAQFFNADGTQKAPFFQVNPTTAGTHAHPKIAGLTDGKVAVVYAMNAPAADGGDGDDYGTFLRIMNADGTFATDEFQINDYTDSYQYTPDIAALTGGGFAVTWRSYGQDGSVSGVYAQIFDAAGAEVGPEFRVTEFTQNNQYQPVITALADGGFTVAWHDDNSGTPGPSRHDVHAQRYAANGDRVDGQMLVTPEDNVAQYEPALAGRPDGGFIVAWRSDAGEDGDGASILHKVYGDPGNYAFQNVSETLGVNPAAAIDESAFDDGPQLLDADGAVGFTPGLGATFGGGAIEVRRSTFTDVDAGFLPGDDREQDVLGLRDQGPGEGLIQVAGGVVSHGGVAVGTIAEAGQELSIDLAPGAGADAVRAILENITYFNGSDDPAASRLYAITVRDAIGALTQPSYVTVTVTPAKDSALEQVAPPTLANALIAGDQTAPHSASLADGGWVIAWTDASNDGSGAGVYAQRFDAGGAPMGEMFAVADTQINGQTNARVTALSDGGYAVSWTDGSGADGAEGRAMARLYHPDGTARGAEIQLNTTVAEDQSTPDLTAIAGGFIAAWRSEAVDGSGYAIVAQRFDLTGAPAGGEITLNAHATGSQTEPRLSSLPGGGFVAVWVDDSAQDGSGNSIRGRVFDAAGTALTGDFQINVEGAGAQWEPEITTLEDGGFVVTWRGDQSGVDSFARIYEADGTPRSGEFRVNESTGSSEHQPSVTALDGGGFVAAWYNANSWHTRDGDYAYRDTIAQIFDADGRRIDSEFRVADGGSGHQSSPTVTRVSGGGFAVAYESSNAGGQGDGSGYAIVQAIYSDPAVFAALVAEGPVIDGLSAAASFGEDAVSAAPRRVDADGAVALSLGAGADLDGGRLTVRAVEGQDDQGHDPESQHAFDLLTTGDLPGQVNHDGATVTYGGVAVGAMSTAGGVLEVTFNAAATAEAAEAVIGLIAYANSANAPLANLQARVALTDGAGRSVQQTLTLTIAGDPDARPEAIGSTRQVNTTEVQDQTAPSVTELTGGGWVTVWVSDTAAGADSNIIAQRYGADGAMIGAKITINQLTALDQIEPDVTALADGGFFVTWRSQTGDGSLSRVQASSFDAAGVRTVPEFQVNDYTADHQYNPHASLLDNGDMAVVWASRYQSYYQEGVGANDGVYGKIYRVDAGAGTTAEIMGETRLSDTVDGYQNDPRIATMTNGDFVVTYVAQNVDGSGYAAVAKIFGEDGAEVAAEFVLNQQTSSDQSDVEVAALAGGGFIATWTSNGQDGSSRGIYARMFAADGAAAGDEFRANTQITGEQYDPQVVALADGGFAIAWYDEHYRGSHYNYRDLYGQIYDASGARVDEEFRISESSYNDVSNAPTLAALAAGGFIAAWQTNSAASEFGDGSGYSIRMQIFGDPAGPLPVEQAVLGDLAAATLRSPAEVLAGPVLIDPDLSVSDADASGFDGGALRIEISGGGAAEDTLALDLTGDVTMTGADVKVAGVTIGTVDATEDGAAGAPLKIMFNGAADAAAVQAVAEALTWASSLADPTGAAKTFLYTLDDGAFSQPWDGSGTLTVGAPPSIALTGFDAAPVITETALEAGPQRLFATAEFEYNALNLFGGGYVRLDHDYPSTGHPAQRPSYASDQFTVINEGTGAGQIGFDGTTVTYEGTLIGTVDGSETGLNGANFKINLDAAADEAGVRALIRAIAYDSTSDTMGGTPYFDIEVRDGGGVTTGVLSVNLTVAGDPDQPDALTGEIRVNAETFDNQHGPFMARLTDGNVVTAWHSEQQDIGGVDDWGVFVQLWDARGAKIGGEIQVNQTEAGEQYARDVTALSDGRFVVGFHNNADVYFRIHNADGSPAGDEISAAELTSSTQTDIGIAALDAGTFMAVWTSYGADPSGYGIAGRVFNADGSPASAEFDVNVETSSTQDLPAVTTLSNGNVAALWTSNTSATAGDGSGDAVVMRIFTPTGAALTPTETIVNTYTSSNQDTPAVAALAGGGFVVVWESTQDGSGNGVFAQIFDTDGVKIGVEFGVNDLIYSEQIGAEVIGLSGGGFAVAWYSQWFDGSGYGAYAKTYDAAGNPTSDEFLVNTNTSGNQYAVDLVALDNDGFAVGFYSDTSGTSGDGSGAGTYMRFYGDAAAYGAIADPIVVGFAPSVTLNEADAQAGLMRLDPAVGFAERDTTDFSGGSLTLTRAIAGGNIETFNAPDDATQDQLGILSDGTGVGQISVSGATVMFEGTAFGAIVSGGADGAPLRVDFTTSAATRPAVEALIQALGYANVSDAPAATRSFGLTVDDGAGGRSAQALIEVVVTPEIDGAVPLAGEVQVNSFTVGEQHEAAIAQLSGGGYVVVWRSVNQALPGDGAHDVYGQVFTDDGQPVGGQLTLGQTPQGSQHNPMVTGLDDGGFAVAWRDDNAAQDGSNAAVVGRVFEADGTGRTDEFVVNEHTNDYQLHPALTAVPGGFVATWASHNQDGSDYGVWQRAYGNDGAATGPEMQVNQATSGTQYLPQVAGFDGGGHVTVWTSNASLALGGDGSGHGVFARRCDASGVALGDEEQINTITNSDQYRPDVATFDDGRHAVVWRDSAADGSGEGVYARLFAADGTPEGDEVRVALTAAGNQNDAHVAVLSDGRFAVGWTSELNTDEGVGTGGAAGVFVQLFAADGTRIDDPLVVSEQRHGAQLGIEIAPLAGGRFAVTWSSNYYNADNRADGDNYGVFTRVYGAAGEELTALPPQLLGIDPVRNVTEAEVNAGPVLLDADGASSVIDGDTVDFGGAELRVTRTSAELAGILLNDGDDHAQDALSVRDQGAAPGQVGLSGATVTFGGAPIAALVSDGQAGADLMIAFAAGATAHQVSAVIETLTYANASDDPFAARTLRLTLTDPDGAVSAPYVITVNVAPETDLAAPAGTEAQANSWIADAQTAPVVATLSDLPGGAPTGYVVVWTSTNQDNNGDALTGVFAQVYTLSGAPVGAEIQINATVPGHQNQPTAVGVDGGGFMVAWTDGGGLDGASNGVFARYFDGTGGALTGEIGVNTTTPNHQDGPSATRLADGDIVIGWSGYGATGDRAYTQRFDAAGGRVGVQTAASSDPSGIYSDHQHVSVAALTGGGYVVAFHADARIGAALNDDIADSYGVYAARFNAAGNALSSLPVQVNTFTYSTQYQPVAAGLADGGHVIAWQSYTQDTSVYGIFAQRFAADGTPVGDELLVNESLAEDQRDAAIIGLESGGFVIGWHDDYGNARGSGICG